MRAANKALIMCLLLWFTVDLSGKLQIVSVNIDYNNRDNEPTEGFIILRLIK